MCHHSSLDDISNWVQHALHLCLLKPFECNPVCNHYQLIKTSICEKTSFPFVSSIKYSSITLGKIEEMTFNMSMD